jgi:cell wall-associated NlpC family hydrolase
MPGELPCLRDRVRPDPRTTGIWPQGPVRFPIQNRFQHPRSFADPEILRTHHQNPLLAPFRGGNGPQLTEHPSGRTVRTGGFDCSGLVKAADAAAGIDLPRTAQTQYNAGPLLAPAPPLEAGDLLFFGTPTAVHHVGIYTGRDHQMIDAPHHGAFVRVEDYTTWPDFIAAS